MALYRHLDDGETLYLEKTPAQAVYVIVKGKVKTCFNNEDTIFEEGEVVGAFDALLGRNYTKTAIAVGKVTVEVISKVDQIKQMEKSFTLRIVAGLLRKLDIETPGRWS